MEKNNYKLIADYHTHSVYSKNGHGKSTIRENVEQAVKLGLKEIYITDHGPGHIFFGITRKKIPLIRKEIDELNKEFNGIIEIVFGVEANIVDYNGRYDILDEELQYFDIINLGYHSGVAFKNFKSFFTFFVLNRLGKFNKKLENYCIKKNTDALIKIVNEKNIHMITHPGDKAKVDIIKLAKACEKNNTLLEINTHHENLTVEEIKTLKNSKVNFGIGSDAHKSINVGNVTNSIDRIRKSGLDTARVINLEKK